MEQQFEEMVKNRGKLRQMAVRRARENLEKKPQIEMPVELMNTEEREKMADAINKVSGGEKGLRRVIGRRKGKGKMDEEMSSDEEAEVEVFAGGAKMLGRRFAEHLSGLHNKDYMNDFMEGYKAGIGETNGVMMKGGIMTQGDAPGGRRFKPSGLQVNTSELTPVAKSLPGSGTTGANIPPGGVGPKAYGGVPYAPASFKRNSVNVGQDLPGYSAIRGSGKKASEKKPVVKGGAKHTRGQMISMLMKQKGMNLGEASKYLKEHPDM
jgi:hypothetical protein